MAKPQNKIDRTISTYSDARLSRSAFLLHWVQKNGSSSERQPCKLNDLSVLSKKGDYSPAGVGGFGRGGRGAAGLTAVDPGRAAAAGRAAGRAEGRAWGFATLKDLIFS
jgi:hypothetical protein